MEIAVVGGLGFIGAYVCSALRRAGHKVKTIDIRNDTESTGPDQFYSDITDFDSAEKALRGIDMAYCFAGTVLGDAQKNTHKAVELDIYGTTNVLEACVSNKVKKVLYASSFYVYDGLTNDIDVDERNCSDIFKAETFGVVKMVAERLISEYHMRHNLSYVIFRLGPVYGPDKRCTSLICDFITSGLSGKPIEVWGRGSRKNQYTYVEDVARACVDSLALSNQVMNIISPQQFSVSEIAEMLLKKHGFKVEYRRDKQEGPSLPYISPEKAIRLLNWQSTPLDVGIDKTLKALRERQ